MKSALSSLIRLQAQFHFQTFFCHDFDPFFCQKFHPFGKEGSPTFMGTKSLMLI